MIRACTCAAIAAVAVPACFASAQQIWDADDGTTTFIKANFADWTLAENQDAITSNVVLTRGNTASIFNIAIESAFQGSASPADTEWAFSAVPPETDFQGNAAFNFGDGASNFAALNFQNFVPALASAVGTNVVNRPGVLHLITDDIYIDIMFTSFTGGNNGGGFSYIRAIPAPSTAALGILALSATMRRKR